MSKWPVVPLGEIFNIARGGSPRPIDAFTTDDPEGVNWIMISDASASSKYIYSTRNKIKQEGALRSRLVEYGDLILTNSMSFGRPYIMRTSGCIHDGWLVLSKRGDFIDEDFFYHLIGSDAIYSEFKRLAGGAVVKNLNIDLVEGVKVPLPPLPEQLRIAAILNQAETLRSARRRALAKLDTLTQAVFVEMFGDPVANPNSYPLKPLAEIVDPQRPITYGILKPGPDHADGVPYVRVVDMKNGTVDATGLRKTTLEIAREYRRSTLKQGDLLMSIRGHVGRLAIAGTELEGANITQDTARLAITGADAYYVAECLRTPGLQRWMQRRTKGVAVQGINLGDVKQMPIPVPPEPLQHLFAQRAEITMQQQTNQRVSMGKLNALFASLQHRAFRGEL